MFELSGLLAIQILRKEKLGNGHPFMINSPQLPEGQCYLEYPNGLIQIVALSKSRKDFEKIKQLSKKESISLLQSLQLT